MKLRKTLANGIEVIADTNTRLHSFSAIVRIRAGSAYEQAEDWGITHMMEHCINRSLKWRFEKDFYSLMSWNGIQFDLYTRYDNTEYQILGSPAGIPMAADMLRKMFLPIALSDEEFGLEKDRVLAEIAGDWPQQDPFWETSTLGWSVQGTAEQVEQFSQSQLNAYMESILVPGNVALCLTGCIDEAAMALLLEAAEAIPMYAGPPAPRELPMPVDFGKRTRYLNYKAAVDRARFAFDVPPQECAGAAVELLNEIMFDGLDALLYQHLSENTGLVYGYTSHRQTYRSGGSLEFRFDFDPSRGQPTMDAVDAAITQVWAGGFDLESKKRALLADWEMLQDNPFKLGEWMLNQLTLTDSPAPPDWAAVTKEDVVACARTIFSAGVITIWHQADWTEARQTADKT